MSGDKIYRLPPYILGEAMVRTLSESIDWGQRVQNMEKVWDLVKTPGKGVRVCVVDTGRPTHRDLKDKVVASRNFSRSFTDVDQQGHSTHVCGTIAALKNDQGVVGGAYDAELIIAKVLGDDGSGTNSAVARGIRYGVQQGADIISMSLGGPYDTDIEAACREADAAGVLLVSAAGNSGHTPGSNTVDWPARLDECTAVGAYNRDGKIANFSSRGPDVDFAFPGQDIMSTWLNDTFRAISGTSMATPFMSATVAVCLSYLRDKLKVKSVPGFRSTAELVETYSKFAVDKGAAGKDEHWGFGVVDVYKMLTQWDTGVTTPVTTTTTQPPKPPVTPEERIVIPPDETDLVLEFLGLRIKSDVLLGDRRGVYVYSKNK